MCFSFFDSYMSSSWSYAGKYWRGWLSSQCLVKCIHVGRNTHQHFSCLPLFIGTFALFSPRCPVFLVNLWLPQNPVLWCFTTASPSSACSMLCISLFLPLQPFHYGFPSLVISELINVNDLLWLTTMFRSNAYSTYPLVWVKICLHKQSQKSN